MGVYLWSELSHRPGRSLGTVLGVAIGVALFIALTAMGDGFRDAARLPLAGIGADILLSRPAGGADTSAAAQVVRGIRLPFGVSTLTVDDAHRVEGIQGVGAVAAGLLLWDFASAAYQTVLGVDVTQPAVGPSQVRQSVLTGRFLEPGDRHVAVVDRHYAAFYRFKPGDTVTIGGQPFPVVGIAEVQGGNQAAAANFYIPLADAQELAQFDDKTVDQIYVRVKAASSVDQVVHDSQAALGQLSATTEQSIVQVMGGISRVSKRFAGAAALVALLGGLLLTGLALSASVAERGVEIGVMKAVGWTARDVMRHFVAEGLALALVGAAIGITVGGLATLGLGLIPVDFSGLNLGNTPLGLSSTSPAASTLTLPAHITWGPVVLALGVTCLGGALASWLVARHAAALKPAEAFRQQ